jgi:hypothetical protein
LRHIIDGWLLTPQGVATMGNCRLVKTQKLLNQLLMLVESEIEERSVKRKGGLE